MSFIEIRRLSVILNLTPQKQFDIGRSLKEGQIKVIQTQIQCISKTSLGLFVSIILIDPKPTVSSILFKTPEIIHNNLVVNELYGLN